MHTETKKEVNIQIIWFYKDIDGLVLVTCRLQVKRRPIVKEFTGINKNNFARNFCKYYSLNSVIGERIDCQLNVYMKWKGLSSI